MRPFAFLVLTLVAIATLAGCPQHPSDPNVPPPTDADEVVLLPFPPDGGAATWDDWVGAFVGDYCVECHSPSAKCGGDGCHASGDPVLFDLRDRSAVVAHAQAIRCGVGATDDPDPSCAGFTAKEFPKWNGSNPLPTDEQRALLQGWFDAGMP